MELYIDPDGVSTAMRNAEREVDELLDILTACDQHMSILREGLTAGAPGVAERLAHLADGEKASRRMGSQAAFAARQNLAANVADFVEFDLQAAKELEELNERLA